MSGAQWARWFGIVIAALNAIGQLAWIQAYPWWSLAIFTVDILIIYALTVYGGKNGPAGAAATASRGGARSWAPPRAAYAANCASSVDPFERERRGHPAGDHLGDLVEVAGADLSLVARRRVAVLLERELVLLEPDVGAHPLVRVAARQLEHRGVERVEAGERDELEPVAQRAELALEARDRVVVEVLAPVERR